MLAQHAASAGRQRLAAQCTCKIVSACSLESDFSSSLPRPPLQLLPHGRPVLPGQPQGSDGPASECWWLDMCIYLGLRVVQRLGQAMHPALSCMDLRRAPIATAHQATCHSLCPAVQVALPADAEGHTGRPVSVSTISPGSSALPTVSACSHRLIHVQSVMPFHPLFVCFCWLQDLEGPGDHHAGDGAGWGWWFSSQTDLPTARGVRLHMLLCASGFLPHPLRRCVADLAPHALAGHPRLAAECGFWAEYF